MKVVTYNIRFGLGLDQKIDLGRITDTVKDADIISLQEVERYWRRSGMVDQPEQIGSLLENFYWSYFPAFDVDTSVVSKNSAVKNRRRQFGVMLLSRWPILSVRSILLPQLPTFNVTGMATGVLEGVVNSPGGALRVYSVHLSSASPQERGMQIDMLLSTHNMIERCGKVMTLDSTPVDPVEAASDQQLDWNNNEPELPVPANTLFLGDFNFSDDSSEYSQFLGEEDPVYGRGIHRGSLVDSWCCAPTKSSDSLTWWPDPPDRPPAKPMRLDYCFVNTEFSKFITRAWVDHEATGSDHKPLWVEFDN